MQGAGCKEQNEPVGQPSLPYAAPCLPWWNGIGSQVPRPALCNPLKALFVDSHSREPGSVKQSGIQSQQLEHSSSQVTGQSQSEGEGVLTGTSRVQHMSSQSDCDATNRDRQQNQQQSTKQAFTSAPAEYLAPHAQLEYGHSVACAAYPYADPYFGGIVAAYGAQAMIHPHILGIQQARMPLPLDMTEEEPVYVNAKQYHGILRRRQSRAKAESENKLIKARKVLCRCLEDMPYLHESRHRHAMKRARGCGGRFLNTKKLEEAKANTNNGKAPEGHAAQAGSSSGSEVLQSENGNINSMQEVQGASGMSGSEVTSVSQPRANGASYHCSHANESYLNHYQHPHFPLSAFHQLSVGSEEDSKEQGRRILSSGSQQRVVVIQ